MSDADRIREVLLQIAELVSSVTQEEGPSGGEHYAEEEGVEAQPASVSGCTLKVLPKRLVVKAAEVARKINPVNAPVPGPLAAMGVQLPLDPLRIALLTSKYWGPATRRLTVSFLESTPANLRARIVQHLNAWATTSSVSFVETGGTGDVRISRGSGGYWSYLGTDVKLIPTHLPTMNLEAFTMNTPESEYCRVIRHEAGHTLGFPHEHMRRELVARIEPKKAYAYFLATQGWDKATVDQQVLTPLDDMSIFATPPDQTSIMCYQLPASITRDGQPILGGVNINATDSMFAGLIYPKFGFAETKAGRKEKVEREEEFVPTMAQAYAQDWGAAQDPQLIM
ncbi:M12 family metallopeptidase [Corallococcus llansteffanensis]|uniref:Peptidase M12 n=1 Tax=Corallococcus llansteffanensis TaxID=2316731 RepID=A0A3A8QE51_9BACT|nr:M12 family metallopeptidase [Corallococcus llansteffanensis]RKH65881.1 peptidase M12 [Corallococcus llansteffanensis]